MRSSVSGYGWAFALVLIATAMVLAPNALAQRGGGMSPEQQDAVWSLQSATVAKELGLSKEAAESLAGAYKAARKGYSEGIEQLSSENLEGSDRYAAFRKVGEEHRAKLGETLSGALDAEQASQAAAVLGTFYWGWDRYTNTVVDLGLEPLKQHDAMVLVNQYAVDVTQLRSQASSSEDRQATREAQRQRKGELDEALKSVLSEEQLAKWTEATTRGRRSSTPEAEPVKMTEEQKAKRDAARERSRKMQE